MKIKQSIAALILVLAAGMAGAVFAADTVIVTGGNLSPKDRQRMEDFRPKFGFDEKIPVLAPDYAVESSWAALPGMKDDADIAPANTAYPENQKEAAADVFFVHPTTSVSTAYWNVPIDDKMASQGVSFVMGASASEFNAAARVYAPRYRQATLYAFFDDRTDSGLKAMELAYGDVERAFLYFIEHYNDGRPFILAGHSQGSIHAIRLLQEKIIGTPLQDRLVAAYLAGGPILKETPGIRPAGTPDATGVLIGWNTYTKEGDAEFFTGSCITWLAGEYRRVDGRPLVQVNPLSWQLNGPAVPPRENPGSLPAVLNRKGPHRIPALIPGVCGADASGAVLIITRPDSRGFELEDEGLSIFNARTGDYHNFDFALFYESIRRNARDRVNAFLRRGN